MKPPTSLVDDLLDDTVCMVSGCPRHALDVGPLPICFGHLREIGGVYDMLREMVYDVPESQILRSRADAEARAIEMAERREQLAVVYYIRIGDHVKIGTSVNVRKRMQALYVQPEALLATEPGWYELESQRHREFADERIDKNRELFNPSPRLLQHIENLRIKAA